MYYNAKDRFYITNGLQQTCAFKRTCEAIKQGEYKVWLKNLKSENTIAYTQKQDPLFILKDFDEKILISCNILVNPTSLSTKSNQVNCYLKLIEPKLLNMFKQYESTQ